MPDVPSAEAIDQFFDMSTSGETSMAEEAIGVPPEQAEAPEGEQAETAPAAEITPEIQALIDARAAELAEEKTKQFQAQWTQKNQDLSAKAKFADQVMSNPRMLAALQALQGGPQTSVASAEPEKPHVFYPDSGFEDFDDKSQKSVKEGAMRAFREHLIPILEPALKELQQVKAELAELRYERATAGVPNAQEEKANVIAFFQQNPNFMADKTPQERIQLAMRVLSPTSANQQTETSQPEKAAAPAKNGTPANGNTLAAALASQTVRSGVPAPKRAPPDPKGKSASQYASEIARQSGMTLDDLARAWRSSLST